MQELINQIDDAIYAHNVWKHLWRDRLNSAGDGSVDVEEIERDDMCEFGKWLYSAQFPEDEKESEDYAKVMVAHKEFHKQAAHVINLMLQRRVDEARDAMTNQGGQYFRASSHLLSLLEKWRYRLVSG